jgi:hypothetical protein
MRMTREDAQRAAHSENPLDLLRSEVAQLRSRVEDLERRMGTPKPSTLQRILNRLAIRKE